MHSSLERRMAEMNTVRGEVIDPSPQSKYTFYQAMHILFIQEMDDILLKARIQEAAYNIM